MVTILATADATTVLDGFTVTKGKETRTGDTTVAGGITSLGGSPALANLVILDNVGRSIGAGMYSVGGSPTLSGARFAVNSITGSSPPPFGGLESDGGSLTVTDARFVGSTSNGSLVRIGAGSASLARVEFVGFDSGTAISTSTSTELEIVDATMTGFQFAVTTGADSSATISRSFFEDNGTHLRGSGAITATNVTITGGAQAIADISATDTAVFDLNSVTVSGLLSWISPAQQPGSLVATNIIAWDTVTPALAAGTVTLSHSVIEGGCPANVACTAVSSVDPQLSAPFDNGGLTKTIAIPTSSSAVDSGASGGCPPTDQRGLARPADGNGTGGAACDAGAFELHPTSFLFFSAASTIAEAEGSGQIPVVLDSTPSGTVTVEYAVSGGTAVPGEDFVLAAGEITLTPLKQSTFIDFTVVDDAEDESDETIIVTLSNPTNALLRSPSVHTGTISGTPAVAQFKAGGATVSEAADEATVEVVLDHAVASGASVEFAVTGGSATNGKDYALANGTLSLNPGALTQAFTIDLRDDFLVEPLETVVVTLSEPTNAVLGPASAFTLSLTDNEPRGKCAGKAATIVGTAGAETIAGTAGADVILALGGGDTIRASGGNDTVCAGGGDDSVTAAGGKDLVLGGRGADIVKGGAGNDELRGEGGTDQLDGQGGKDRLAGGNGAGDRCTGGPGVDALPPAHGCEVIVGVP